MEVNTVKLELSKYEKLKEYKKAVEESKFICYQPWNGEITALKESEVVNILKQENEYLQKEINNLRNPNKNEKTIEDIKQMNLLSLIKWKLTKS